MAGGSSGGHGFGVPKEINGKKVDKIKKLNEPEQKIKDFYPRNEIRTVNERPKMEMHRVQRMDATPNQRMTQTTRDNRTILEDAFRKQRRNKT